MSKLKRMQYWGVSASISLMGTNAQPSRHIFIDFNTDYIYFSILLLNVKNTFYLAEIEITYYFRYGRKTPLSCMTWL